MWPTVLEEGCFALTDTHSLTVEGGKGISIYKPGPSRVSGVLTDVIDMS